MNNNKPKINPSNKLFASNSELARFGSSQTLTQEGVDLNQYSDQEKISILQNNQANQGLDAISVAQRPLKEAFNSMMFVNDLQNNLNAKEGISPHNPSEVYNKHSVVKDEDGVFYMSKTENNTEPLLQNFESKPNGYKLGLGGSFQHGSIKLTKGQYKGKTLVATKDASDVNQAGLYMYDEKGNYEKILFTVISDRTHENQSQWLNRAAVFFNIIETNVEDLFLLMEYDSVFCLDLRKKNIHQKYDLKILNPKTDDELLQGNSLHWKNNMKEIHVMQGKALFFARDLSSIYSVDLNNPLQGSNLIVNIQGKDENLHYNFAASCARSVNEFFLTSYPSSKTIDGVSYSTVNEGIFKATVTLNSDEQADVSFQQLTNSGYFRKGIIRLRDNRIVAISHKSADEIVVINTDDTLVKYVNKLGSTDSYTDLVMENEDTDNLIILGSLRQITGLTVVDLNQIKEDSGDLTGINDLARSGGARAGMDSCVKINGGYGSCCSFINKDNEKNYIVACSKDNNHVFFLDQNFEHIPFGEKSYKIEDNFFNISNTEGNRHSYSELVFSPGEKRIIVTYGPSGEVERKDHIFYFDGAVEYENEYWKVILTPHFFNDIAFAVAILEDFYGQFIESIIEISSEAQQRYRHGADIDKSDMANYYEQHGFSESEFDISNILTWPFSFSEVSYDFDSNGQPIPRPVPNIGFLESPLESSYSFEFNLNNCHQNTKDALTEKLQALQEAIGNQQTINMAKLNCQITVKSGFKEQEKRFGKVAIKIRPIISEIVAGELIENIDAKNYIEIYTSSSNNNGLVSRVSTEDGGFKYQLDESIPLKDQFTLSEPKALEVEIVENVKLTGTIENKITVESYRENDIDYLVINKNGSISTFEIPDEDRGKTNPPVVVVDPLGKYVYLNSGRIVKPEGEFQQTERYVISLRFDVENQKFEKTADIIYDDLNRKLANESWGADNIKNVFAFEENLMTLMLATMNPEYQIHVNQVAGQPQDIEGIIYPNGFHPVQHENLVRAGYFITKPGLEGDSWWEDTLELDKLGLKLTRGFIYQYFDSDHHDDARLDDQYNSDRAVKDVGFLRKKINRSLKALYEEVVRNEGVQNKRWYDKIDFSDDGSFVAMSAASGDDYMLYTRKSMTMYVNNVGYFPSTESEFLAPSLILLNEGSFGWSGFSRIGCGADFSRGKLTGAAREGVGSGVGEYFEDLLGQVSGTHPRNLMSTHMKENYEFPNTGFYGVIDSFVCVRRAGIVEELEVLKRDWVSHSTSTAGDFDINFLSVKKINGDFHLFVDLKKRNVPAVLYESMNTYGEAYFGVSSINYFRVDKVVHNNEHRRFSSKDGAVVIDDKVFIPEKSTLLHFKVDNKGCLKVNNYQNFLDRIEKPEIWESSMFIDPSMGKLAKIEYFTSVRYSFKSTSWDERGESSGGNGYDNPSSQYETGEFRLHLPFHNSGAIAQTTDTYNTHYDAGLGFNDINQWATGEMKDWEGSAHTGSAYLYHAPIIYGNSTNISARAPYRVTPAETENPHDFLIQNNPTAGTLATVFANEFNISVNEEGYIMNKIIGGYFSAGDNFLYLLSENPEIGAVKVDIETGSVITKADSFVADSENADSELTDVVYSKNSHCFNKTEGINVRVPNNKDAIIVEKNGAETIIKGKFGTDDINILSCDFELDSKNVIIISANENLKKCIFNIDTFNLSVNVDDKQYSSASTIIYKEQKDLIANVLVEKGSIQQ